MEDPSRTPLGPMKSPMSSCSGRFRNGCGQHCPSHQFRGDQCDHDFRLNFGERRRRLQELIGEIEGRIDASPRGKDLERFLKRRETALRLVEERERAEGDRS